MCSMGPISRQGDLGQGPTEGARFVTNNYKRDSSVSAMIEELKWDPLDDRQHKSRVNMMNKIVSGRVAINIDEHLTRASTRTRSANSIKFRTLSAKTVLYQNSLPEL